MERVTFAEHENAKTEIIKPESRVYDETAERAESADTNNIVRYLRVKSFCTSKKR